MKMKKKTLFTFLLFDLFTVSLTGCKKEIDFDYHEIAPVVVIEGRVTNEGMEVLVTTSRSVTDSVHPRCLQGAAVSITGNGVTTVLPYDAATDSYHSAVTGKAGETYHLSVDYDGRHYEASATMHDAAPILSANFYWMSMLGERMLVYELWAVDPDAAERNYYWYRVDRISKHPHILQMKSQAQEPYRWSVRDDRGCPPGKFFLDVMATSEKAMDEDKEENWKSIFYEGDKVVCRLMTIDRPVYDYFTSLRAGQSGGANPRTNISGGCLGFFAAGTVTRTDTIVYHKSDVQDWKPTMQ
jgi:hypothetical protein